MGSNEKQAAEESRNAFENNADGEMSPAISTMFQIMMLIPFVLALWLRWDYARWEKENPKPKDAPVAKKRSE